VEEAEKLFIMIDLKANKPHPPHSYVYTSPPTEDEK
jgi:hypothetical protein